MWSDDPRIHTFVQSVSILLLPGTMHSPMRRSSSAFTRTTSSKSACLRLNGGGGLGEIGRKGRGQTALTDRMCKWQTGYSDVNTTSLPPMAEIRAKPFRALHHFLHPAWAADADARRHFPPPPMDQPTSPVTRLDMIVHLQTLGHRLHSLRLGLLLAEAHATDIHDKLRTLPHQRRPQNRSQMGR